MQAILTSHLGMIHSHSFHAPPAGWFLLVESTRHWEEDGSGALIQAIFLTQNASFSAYPVPCLHTLKVLNVSVLGLGLFKSSLLTPLLLHGNNMKRTSLWSSYGCEVWIPNLLVLVHWNLSLWHPSFVCPLCCCCSDLGRSPPLELDVRLVRVGWNGL